MSKTKVFINCIEQNENYFIDVICNKECDQNEECIGCKKYKKCYDCKQYFCSFLVTGFPPNIYRKKYLYYCKKCNPDFKPRGAPTPKIEDIEFIDD